jgi:hypothetical protein
MITDAGVGVGRTARPCVVRTSVIVPASFHTCVCARDEAAVIIGDSGAYDFWL